MWRIRKIYIIPFSLWNHISFLFSLRISSSHIYSWEPFADLGIPSEFHSHMFILEGLLLTWTSLEPKIHTYFKMIKCLWFPVTTKLSALIFVFWIQLLLLISYLLFSYIHYNYLSLSIRTINILLTVAVIKQRNKCYWQCIA